MPISTQPLWQAAAPPNKSGQASKQAQVDMHPLSLRTEFALLLPCLPTELLLHEACSIRLRHLF